jgi:hypothetical protein
MKLKLVIVDLELPPRFKKWAIRLGVFAVFALGASAIAWAAGLHTWAQGDVLNATDLNGNFTTLQQQITTLQGQTSGAIAAGAYITDSAAGAAIGYQSGGNWIQSVSRSSTGVIQLTLAPTYFSSNAPCTVTANSNAPVLATLPSVVTTAIQVVLQTPAGAPTDASFMIVCVQQHG